VNPRPVLPLTAAAGLVSVLLAAVSPVSGQNRPGGADSAAIVRTALDYIEGFYTGDTTRMGRAIHPELAKRIVYPPREPGGKQTLDHMGAAKLLANTQAMATRQVPADRP